MATEKQKQHIISINIEGHIMSAACGKGVAVKVSYTIRGEETQSVVLNESNVPLARVGLPKDAVAVKPIPGDFSYSGRHDRGDLPLPHENGPIAQLLSCVQKAKKCNDSYLTDLIESERGKNPSKKPRTKT